MCDLKIKEIGDLPDEVLLEVHQRLPPSALKMAILVNKLWRAVGEAPTLWKKFTVTVYSKEDIRNLSIKRLRRIEDISINPGDWDTEDWEAFFRAVMGLARLKKIDGLGEAGVGLKFVESSLFARSLAKLEVVDVHGCTGDHIQALFSEMSISTQIKKLDLSFCHLSQLVPGLFGKVLSRLEDLDLGYNDTTKDQMEAFFREILNNNCLKRLVLNEISLRYLKPGLFASALSKVEDVRLTNYVAADLQLEALLTELSSGTHQLKRLELHGGDLSQMQPALVAHVLSRLEELSLRYSHISNNQVQALFREMSHLTQMKKLALYGVDLSQLEAGLFAKVMARLDDVVLCRSNDITAEQKGAFFTEVSRNSNLKALDINGVDLSSVDPEILAKAVTRLEEVFLGTRITSDQSISLFSEMSRNLQMKKIDLGWNDLSSVDPQDFARALTRMEDVSLYSNKITHDQAMAFFTKMSQNTQLKKLQLRDDLSTVDAEILASALTKVKEVDLTGSTLSTEQIDSIFTCVLESERKLKKLDLSYTGAADQVDPEIVRKVKDKLKGELKMAE